MTLFKIESGTLPRIFSLALVATLAATSTACGDADGGDGDGDGDGDCTRDETYRPVLSPSAFVASVTNPLFPLVPGTTFNYTEDPDMTVEVVVLPEAKVIQGITCTVVRDTVRKGTEVIEDTYDWYAQDNLGNVWYMGEDTKEYEGGVVVSTEGSWEHGVMEAIAGTIIPAMPVVGQAYFQEYYPCEALDRADVLDLNASATVPYRSFTGGCYKTHDFTSLDPEVNEQKTYCPGVGLVLAVDVPTGDKEQLISVRTSTAIPPG